MDDLDYLKKGRTIYDFLEKQFPFLRGDFSTQGLLEGTLRFSTDQDFFVGPYKETYRNAVKTIRTNPSEYKKGEPDERMLLLASLYSMQSYDSNLPAFKTLDEYLDFTTKEENIINPKFADIRRRILSVGIQYLDPEELSTLRSNLLKGIYLPKARQVIRKKNEALGISGDTPEIRTILEIGNLVRDPLRLAEYDGIIERVRARGDDFEKKAVEDVITTYRRARVVQAGLLSAAPEDRAKAMSGSSLDVSRLLFGHKEIEQKDDSYTWTIDKFDFPKLILNEDVSYSPDGAADQKVIAISYGKFRYGTMHQTDGKPTVTSDLLELVGISRIGDDGKKDYYVLVPMDNQAYKTNGHFDISKYMQEQKKPKVSNLRKYGYFDEMYEFDVDRIPPELREFYASVFFSDIYLREAISKNYRFTGWIEMSESGKPQIKADDTMVGNAYDLEAARFAATHGTQDFTFSSLDAPAAFVEFYRLQNGIVDSILENERQGRTAEEINGIVIDNPRRRFRRKINVKKSLETRHIYLSNTSSNGIFWKYGKIKYNDSCMDWYNKY